LNATSATNRYRTASGSDRPLNNPIGNIQKGRSLPLAVL